jgi:hypothetical protein
LQQLERLKPVVLDEYHRCSGPLLGPLQRRHGSGRANRSIHRCQRYRRAT